MDDKRIEQLLRDSWSPEPPDGMRERVLDRAGRQTRRGWTLFPILPRWQAAVIAASLLVMLFTGLCDHARSVRLASMSDGVLSRDTRLAACPQTFGMLRLEVDRMLEHPSSADLQ